MYKTVQNSLEDKTEVKVNAFVMDEFGNLWFSYVHSV